MEVQTNYTWERSPGEEITLTIGGHYEPSQTLNEFEGWEQESIHLDWFNDGHNTYLINTVNFQPSELDAMTDLLLQAAHEKCRAKAQSPDLMSNLRKLLNLPEFTPAKGFIE